MRAVFLAYLDQFRAIIGLMAACFLFCRHAVPRRERFALRAALSGVLCVAAGFAYVPLEPRLAALPMLAYGAASVGYWLLVTAMVGSSVYGCYAISPCNAPFRVLLGCTLESIATTVVRYLIVMMWLPRLPQENPALYIFLMLAIYLALYCFVYRLIARPLQRDGEVVTESISSMRTYVLIILAFLLIMYATNGICEWVIPSMGEEATFHLQYRLIRYFCVGIRLLVSVAFLVSQYFVFETHFLERERDMIDRLLHQKSEQYEFSRANVELIQRKCHDLKRQLRALEFAGEDERRAVLEETRRAAEFYDAVVHTGNEALDTLLTEKSLLCAQRGIRLSCTVNARELGAVGMVDLYTMLSNALDNAVEAVENLSEPQKRTISFSLTRRGGMLLIAVENYYEGTLRMRDGLPVTRKEDEDNHGIGLRSIRTLAERYGGDIRISAENGIFLLQVMLSMAQLDGK